MSLPTAPGPAGPPKVAIPKLLQKRPDPPRKAAIARLNRVNRACLSCRARKIKCNGVQPKCANCRENVTPCVYASSRKDRLKTATGQNQNMVELLQDLREHVSDEAQSRIDDMLASVVEDVADAAASLQRGASADKNEEAEGNQDEDQEESNASADVGRSADLYLLDEDRMQEERTLAGGFSGRAFDIDWHRDKLHTNRSGEESLLVRTNKASFFLDDEIVSLDLKVDPFELPSFEDAERLLQSYMTSCHNSFPFLAKKAFTQQFYHYYAALKRGNPYEPSQKWQAQVNLVFAIGAVYSHLTATPWRGDERDHLVYHSRAWALSCKDPWWFTHPNLPQMQIIGLLSFYYMCTGHINRSWVLSGMALRFGSALGLHSRNEDPASGAAKKEILSRVWWGHYALERLLATMTGRPSIGVNRICSVPLPLPLSSTDIEDAIIESRFSEQPPRPASLLPQFSSTSSAATPDSSRHMIPDPPSSNLVQANSGSYLKSTIQLGEITQDTLSLYTANTGDQAWQQIQETIFRLSEEIDSWAKSLPDGFNFLKLTSFARLHQVRERNALDILYHGTIILITRPCLCRLDRRINHQTTRSSEFDQRSALTCVESAKAVARLLPDGPDVDIAALYDAGPWWTMVHTIMQSLTVLLLEISFETIQLPHHRREIVNSLKKLVRWLRSMKSTNGMARRAYSLVMSMLKVLVMTVKMDISDLFQEDEQANAAAATAEARASLLRHASSTSSSHRPADNPASRNHNPFQRASNLVQNTITEPYRPTINPPLSPKAHRGMPENPGHAYLDLFSDLWDTSASDFPGMFFTKFDEQNPLSGFGGNDSDHIMGGTENERQKLPSIAMKASSGSQQ